MMSAVAASPAAPVVVAAGVASGGGGAAVGALPATGSGLTVLLLVMALTFVLVGLVLQWNPLGRGLAAQTELMTLPDDPDGHLS